MQSNYTTSIIIIFDGLMQLLAGELIMMMNKGIVDCKNIWKCRWRNEYGSNPPSYEHYILISSYTVVKRPEKLLRAVQNFNPWPLQTSAVLYQLTYQANWELAIMPVPSKPRKWQINDYYKHMKIIYVNCSWRYGSNQCTCKFSELTL